MTLEEAQAHLVERTAREGMAEVARVRATRSLSPPRPPPTPGEVASWAEGDRINDVEAELHVERMAEARAVVAAAAKRPVKRPAPRARRRAASTRPRRARAKPTDDDGPPAHEARS